MRKLYIDSWDRACNKEGSGTAKETKLSQFLIYLAVRGHLSLMKFYIQWILAGEFVCNLTYYLMFFLLNQLQVLVVSPLLTCVQETRYIP